MQKFINQTDSILLDPIFFEEFLKKKKYGIPFYSNGETYVFSENKFVISNLKFLLISSEEYKEKTYLVENYEKWKIERKFEENAYIRSILEFILIEAIVKNTSDIHFDCIDIEKYLVKFKINTFLEDFCELNKEQYNSIIMCLKVLATLDVSQKKLPQSSSFYKIFKGNEVDFRISTHPTFFCERCVIRILQKKSVIEIENLNLEEDVSNIVQKIIKSPSGIAIFTGPTNSGKTTLIHSILKEIAKQNVNIMTLEDPVEYRIPGIIQTTVNDTNFTFFEGMRSILRQDPNVIFLGEIRDAKTAQIAMQAAMTGLKVLTTLHSYSITGAIKRLVDMEISFATISECLLAVFSQRLVRKFNGKEYEGLQLVVDARLIQEPEKEIFRKNQIPEIKNRLPEIGQNLIKQNITNSQEIQRIIG